jgi:D-glycero-alpha-D-manno-heptose 1-phosphate guanylyltransferase
MEAIILAGGLGTRLQGVIGAYPKCMAPVNGKPFLSYIFQYLTKQKCTSAILSLGYMHEVVTVWLDKQSFDFPYKVVIENEPLGTGGGIQLAMRQAKTNDVAVLNGDTFFDINLDEMMQFHLSKSSETTLALKDMQQFDRYGIVHTDSTGIITSFEEKKYQDTGMINGGVYIVNTKAFLSRNLPAKFSFEKDYLEKFVSEQKFFGWSSSSYFIDIGIPADYARVQNDFKTIIK